MSNDENETSRKLLARWMFKCGIAWNTVGDSYFRDFVHSLREDFKCPAPETIGGKYLDERFIEIENDAINVNTFFYPCSVHTRVDV